MISLCILLSTLSLFPVTSSAAQQILQPQNTAEPDPSEIRNALIQHEIQLETLPQLQRPQERQSCAPACRSLKAIFGGFQVITRDDREEYDEFTGSYWSTQQTEVHPTCVFKPSSATDVAVQILISRLTSCPFAVRSGGHASFAGGSSIENGITVSLESLDGISVSQDRSVVSVGAGSWWGDVYRELEPHHLTVVGGRDSDVGVGGLTLGGGMSFFSNMFGWACDNVAAYEVVLACGRVVVASPEAHTDLYWALRGGGNNFGIVTEFYLFATPLPHGMIWAGARTSFDAGDRRPLLDAFYNMATLGAELDPKASQILSVGYMDGSPVTSTTLQYAEPVASVPSVFDEYFSVFEVEEGAPSGAFSNRTLSNMTDLFSASQPPGRRNTYWTVTFKMDRSVIHRAAAAFDRRLRDRPPRIGGLSAFLLYQTVTTPVLRHMRNRGGDDDEPRVVIGVAMTWDQAADDTRVYEMSRSVIEEMKRAAEEETGRDCRDGYIYMNYASRNQDVVASYGRENTERLARTAREYDPDGVFQLLQPGYHKLPQL